MTTSAEAVDAARMSRHAGHVGDKPSKYWDYNECRWVTCPAPPADIPAQAEPAEKKTSVEMSQEADVRSG